MADVVERLRRIAQDNFATSPAELRRFAKARGLKHTAAELAEALKTNVAAQVLAPKPRFAGVSASEGAGSRLQADLMDFHRPGKGPDHHHFALVTTDVYTRQTQASPLLVKTSLATNAALKKDLQKLPFPDQPTALTTDAGGEFKNVEKVLSNHSVHRLKHSQNDISIVDRAMQTLKVKLAVALANKGGSWSSNLQKVVAAYNDNPRSAVHGPPNDAADESVQGFAVLQDNADRFAHNRDMAEARKAKISELGAVRENIADGGRSFKPRYGPVRQVAEIEPGGLHVVDTEGKQILLKKALPVEKTTAEPQAVFGTKDVKRRIGLTLAQLRKVRLKRPMTKKIPEAASRVFEAASSSASALVPAAKEDRFAYLRMLSGYEKKERTPEEEAERARVAAENREFKAEQKARGQATRDAKAAREKAADDARAAKKAAQQAKKAAQEAKRKK